MINMVQFAQGYALLIGISDYQFVNALPPAVLHDVQALSSVLTDLQACGYPQTQVKTLLNQAATADGMRAGLQWLADETCAEDTAVIYFSGHGGRMEINGQVQNYLVPFDAAVNILPETTISSEELNGWLRRIQASRLVVLFDCCHAGGIGTPKTTSPAATYKVGLQEHIFEQLGQGNGRVIIASSRSNELSWIHADMANSLFTTYLLEGLRGGVGNQQYQVLIMDLFNYVADRVTAKEPRQHPLLKAELENNFPVALAFPPAIPIEGDTKSAIPPDARPIFYQLFKGYQKIVLKKSFSRGWSGAKVFEVRPFKTDNQPELNTVVKLGPASLIQKEWDAYQAVARDKIPQITAIIGKPIFDPDYRWGGLRYPLVGSGVFEVKSLGECLLTLPPEVLEKKIPAWLFPPLEKLWAERQLQTELSLKDGFAFWLPAHLDADCTQLKQEAQAVLGSNIQLESDTLPFSDGRQLPNPLQLLPQILQQKADLFVGPIHGDLNLENILVIRSDNEYNIALIDAANASKNGYILHDLLCLETGILVNVLPPLLAAYPNPLEILYQSLFWLHGQQANQPTTISLPEGLEKPLKFLLICRRKAERYLLSPQNWAELYRGLLIYLLGTLSFTSLDEVGTAVSAKETAFWSAAIMQHLLQDTSEPHPPLEEILFELRAALRQCGPLQTDAELADLFAHPFLEPWRFQLHQRSTVNARVIGTMALLRNEWHAKEKSNALVLFSRILHQEYLDPSTQLYSTLQRLTNQLEKALAAEQKERGLS